MLTTRRFLPGLFLFPLFSIFIFNGCQQEERTYTDEEAQFLIDNLTEIWNGGDIGLIDTIYAAECVRYNADASDAEGPDEIKKFVEWVYKTYPDFRVTFKEPIKLKDGFLTFWSATGTNEGPINEELPATGKAVLFTGIGVTKIENGKFIEEWVYYNQLPLYRQMGFKLVLPEEETE